MQLTKKQRAIGLLFAAELAEMARRAPDVSSKREIYKTVNNLRKKFGLTKEEKISEVLRLIVIGASTRGDLENETGFITSEIHECLAELIERKLVRKQKISVTGTGRPTDCYFPAN